MAAHAGDDPFVERQRARHHHLAGVPGTGLAVLQAQGRIGFAGRIGGGGEIIEQRQAARPVRGCGRQGRLERSTVRSSQQFVGIERDDPVGGQFPCG